MAEIKSFPNNQDVYVGAEWVMKWLHGRTSGVFGAENNLAVSVVPDSMSVQVSDGTGWLSNANGDGIVFWNDREQTSGNKLVLTHDAADGVLDRIDRIVATWETTNYVALPTISILKGTASSDPVASSLTNNNIQRQISLARVNIPAGTVSLSPSMITDERLDPEVCGIVTETIEIDTSTMYAQFTELLERIQNNLEQILADQIPDGSITVPKLADETLSYINAINLADNSDFTQFIAQAGVGGSHGTQAYAGDRWILDSGTVTGEANENGNGYRNITLNGTIRQKIANPPAVGTAVVEMISGTATVTYENGEVTVTSNGGVIGFVKLFPGEYTADNMPKAQPKGYSAELAECQRYYRLLNANGMGNGYTTGNGGMSILLLPFSMRSGVQPTFACDGTIYTRANGADYASTVNGFSIKSGYMELIFMAAGSPAKHAAAFYADGTKAALSADL